jgi:Leucine-rich repeat (LRR) protein
LFDTFLLLVKLYNRFAVLLLQIRSNPENIMPGLQKYKTLPDCSIFLEKTKILIFPLLLLIVILFTGCFLLPPQNQPPSISSKANTSATVGELYSYQVLATDADGDSLSYKLSFSPDGMEISNTGLISWTPTAAGNYQVTVEVSDGKESAKQTFEIKVQEKEEEYYPVIGGGTKPPQSEIVYFPDENLERVIREKIGKPTGPIYLNDVKKIDDDLYASKKGIESLEGMQNLTNLTTLSLGGNQIVDIGPLQNLTNLTTLSLYDNNINNISGLSGLTSLTELNLEDNQIVDIGPLQNLANLTRLDSKNNNINDIQGLSGLTSLTKLFLEGNQIEIIEPLQNLTSLTALNLNNNQISNISALSGLTKLTTLILDDNDISDISPLKELTELTYLSINDNKVIDMTPLENLKKLVTLKFDNNKVVDILTIANMVKLRTLSFKHNEVNDIGPLDEHEAFKAGGLSGRNISMEENYLDLTVGGYTMTIINTLIANDVNVTYELQRTPNP